MLIVCFCCCHLYLVSIDVKVCICIMRAGLVNLNHSLVLIKNGHFLRGQIPIIAERLFVLGVS